jgi:hypothetical protein
VLPFPLRIIFLLSIPREKLLEVFRSLRHFPKKMLSTQRIQHQNQNVRSLHRRTITHQFLSLLHQSLIPKNLKLHFRAILTPLEIQKTMKFSRILRVQILNFLHILQMLVSKKSIMLSDIIFHKFTSRIRHKFQIGFVILHTLPYPIHLDFLAATITILMREIPKKLIESLVPIYPDFWKSANAD